MITDKRYIEYNNIKICPVIIVQCPFDSSVKGLVLEVLRTIDSVLCTKYYANAIRSRATTDIIAGFCLITGLLTDETGNRRFLPVYTTDNRKAAPWDMRETDVDQLWAEAYTMYQNGASIVMPPELQ